MLIAIDPGGKWTGVYIPEINLATEIDSYDLTTSNKTLNYWQSLNPTKFIIENDGYGKNYYHYLINWLKENFPEAGFVYYSCVDAMKDLFGVVLSKNERKYKIEHIYEFKLDEKSKHAVDAIMGYIYFENKIKHTYSVV